MSQDQKSGMAPASGAARLRTGRIVLAAAACVGALAPVLGAADTCYRDDAGRIVTRRLPGYVEVPCPSPQAPASVPGAEPGNGAATAAPSEPGATAGQQRGPDRGAPPSASPIPRPGLTDYPASVPVPDRWRIVDSLGYRNNLWDPYNRNVLKADKPFHADWFFNLSLISDSIYESRDVVSGVGGNSTVRAGGNDAFGRPGQQVYAQSVTTDFRIDKGDTVFKPPDYEFRFTPVFNFNHASVDNLQQINIDPRKGTRRSDHFLGIQNAYIEKHLRDVSERYDFDSVRLGIQAFSTDFRGFLFQDEQLGVRLFGTRHNNVFQYNLAWFRRIEKDTNSGLNDLSQALRRDDVFVANLYWQDMPVSGFVSQATVVYNRNREGDQTHYDTNGFIVRPAAFGIEVPRDYDVVYLGYNGDGHVGPINLTASFYYAVGHERPGTFSFQSTQISAEFAALEISRDFDWIRGRLSLLYGSGDSNPYSRKATGFDAIQENPQFAGADSSYWIREAVPLVGGGGVTLSGPNGVLADLRSSKDEGQSNFINPGIMLAGLGADLDLLPGLRLSLNANDLYFADTEVIAVARNQAFHDRHLGEDLSASIIYRPLFSQNIVLRTSYGELLSGKGADALFPRKNPNYFLFNVLLTY